MHIFFLGGGLSFYPSIPIQKNSVFQQQAVPAFALHCGWIKSISSALKYPSLLCIHGDFLNEASLMKPHSEGKELIPFDSFPSI